MPIPAHIAAYPTRFIHMFESLFGYGGIRRVVIGHGNGVPAESFYSAGVTRVPFMIVCLEGKVEIRLMHDGKIVSYLLKNREGVILTSNTWVACYHDKADRYFRVTFDTDHTILGIDQKGFRPKIPFAQYDDSHNLELYICPFIRSELMRTLLNKIESDRALTREISNNRNTFASTWLLYGCNTLLIELWEMLMNNSEDSHHKGRAMWIAIRNYLEEHYHLALDRQRVANAFGITPNHVSRLFKQFGERGFIATLEQVRLIKSIFLLHHTWLTISEIGYRCGFSSVNYYVRVFKKHFGVAPGTFRAQQTANHSSTSTKMRTLDPYCFLHSDCSGSNPPSRLGL